MRTLFRFLALLMFVCVVISVFGGGALLHSLGGPWDEGLRVSIDGDEVFNSGSGFGTLLGLGITGLVLCVVLPVVLLFSVGLPLLIVGCVAGCIVAALLGVGAIVGSPFILFVLLIVWLLRRSRKPRRGTPRNEPNIQA